MTYDRHSLLPLIFKKSDQTNISQNKPNRKLEPVCTN
jgi:hypothetical protein